jgi:hypothetical protein
MKWTQGGACFHLLYYLPVQSAGVLHTDYAGAGSLVVGLVYSPASRSGVAGAPDSPRFRNQSSL